jgi:hypothetical protein
MFLEMATYTERPAGRKIQIYPVDPNLADEFDRRHRAALVIARRFSLSPSVAQLIIALAGIGGRQ